MTFLKITCSIDPKVFFVRVFLLSVANMADVLKYALAILIFVINLVTSGLASGHAGHAEHD